MNEVYQHLEACKRILDEWEAEEKRLTELQAKYEASTTEEEETTSGRD